MHPPATNPVPLEILPLIHQSLSPLRLSPIGYSGVIGQRIPRLSAWISGSMLFLRRNHRFTGRFLQLSTPIYSYLHLNPNSTLVAFPWSRGPVDYGSSPVLGVLCGLCVRLLA